MADFILSDLHFNHKKMIEKERSRFKDVDEHNKYIIDNINKYIHKTDKVYILGDIGHGENMKELINSINGYKILLKGNHDKNGNDFYKELGFNEVYNHPIFYNKKIILSHEPIPLDKDYFINIHGHLHGAYLDSISHINVSIHMINYKPLRLDKINIQKTKNLKKIKAKFLNEWYADLYVFTIKDETNVVVDKNGKIKLKESLELHKEKSKKG